MMKIKHDRITFVTWYMYGHVQQMTKISHDEILQNENFFARNILKLRYVSMATCTCLFYR